MLTPSFVTFAVLAAIAAVLAMFRYRSRVPEVLAAGNAGEEYWQASITGATGITGIVYVGVTLSGDVLKSLQMGSVKQIPLKVINQLCTGEIRTEEDCSGKFGVIDTNVGIVFEDVGGVSDLTITLPICAWHEWKGETQAEDTKPANFSLRFEAQVPA